MLSHVPSKADTKKCFVNCTGNELSVLPCSLLIAVPPAAVRYQLYCDPADATEHAGIPEPHCDEFTAVGAEGLEVELTVTADVSEGSEHPFASDAVTV